MSLPFEDPAARAYSLLLAESFAHWTGRPLLEKLSSCETPQAAAQDLDPVLALRASQDDDIPHALYHAPFALVSHGTEKDPLFRYANLAAQKLWNIPWERFIGMPSHKSAEPDAQDARKRLLAQAAKHGYVDRYEGIRITAQGNRFRIRDTILWNVVDTSGTRHGQAAMIAKWEWL